MRPASAKIAYILGSFPCLTTTFIDREILEAKRQGLNMVLVSIRPPTPFQMAPDIEKMAQQTKYILPVRLLEFLRANLYFILTRPWVYSSTLFHLLTRNHSTAVARMTTLFHFLEGVWAAALIRDDNVGHIHAHFADRAAIVALVASRLLRVRYSLTAHASDIYVSPVMLYEKIANAKFAVTCTAYNQAHLQAATGHRIELVYHGLDLSGIKSDSGPLCTPQPPLILSVGQLKEKKGFPHLIAACRRLEELGYGFRCEIIGEGSMRRELEDLIDDLELHGKVILRGALPNADVMDRYRQATVFVLPCVLAGDGDRDGIPNVLLESLVNYVPVISTNVSGIPEVVQDGVTGLLVDSRDEKALGEAIIRLLDDSGLRSRLARQGRQWVIENFDVRTNVARLIELLTDEAGECRSCP